MSDTKKVEVELPERVFELLEINSKEHGHSFNTELVSVLEEYLSLPEEVLETGADIAELKSQLRQLKEETSDFEAEVNRRIKLLFHLST
jgi:plasmid stability protein